MRERSVRRFNAYEAIVSTHATTWHDGGAAVFLPLTGAIYAISAERIGDRYKHSWNSAIALDHLANLLHVDLQSANVFYDCSNPGETGVLERDGHHYYHAMEAYSGSGWVNSTILVVDGQGPQDGRNWSTSIWSGTNGEVTLVEDVTSSDLPFVPQSLGHFYSAIGAAAGIRNLNAEGTTMALAGVGAPSPLVNFLANKVFIDARGLMQPTPEFTAALLAHTLGRDFYEWGDPDEQQALIWNEYLAHRNSLPATNSRDIGEDDANFAFAGQDALQNCLASLVDRAYSVAPSMNLCLSGGVALNCVANSFVRQNGPFRRVYVSSAPGDDGQALGRLWATIRLLGYPPNPTGRSRSPYLGPVHRPHDTARAAALAVEKGYTVHKTLTSGEAASIVAQGIAKGEIWGICRGRSELGPRALGNRSILADPRRIEMKARLNELKDREPYRPFAPVVPIEAAISYFESSGPSPYMSFTSMVRPEFQSLLGAITHADGSTRTQTLSRGANSVLESILAEVFKSSGLPIVLNTSFNRGGEPIVETPIDAVETGSAMELDGMLIGRWACWRA